MIAPQAGRLGRLDLDRPLGEAWVTVPVRAGLLVTSEYSLAEPARPGRLRSHKRQDDLPDWVGDPADVRVIAEAASVKLYVTREETEANGTTAVALDFDSTGRPERYELFFDSETSQPLAFIENRREPQEWVDGLLLEYRVLVESGPVTSIESRP
jgi:hypothetical protein